MAGDRVNTYVIRALLKDDGPARVMDGSFVLMDIAAAQLAFDRLGRVDRVDVQLTAPEASRRRCRHRRIAGGHRRAAAGRADRAAPGAARRAGRADAGGLPPEPDRAVVGGAGRRAVPRLQHRHDLGNRAARGDRHAARARRRRGGRCWRCSSARRRCSASPAPCSASASAAGAGRRRRRRSPRHREHALHRRRPPRRRRLARGTSRWRSPSASRCRCSRRRGAGPRGEPGAADRGDARRRPLEIALPPAARAPGRAGAGARRRRRPGAARPVDGLPLFGYASSFVTIIGASLLVPAIIYGLARVVRPAAAPAARRRGPARARQPRGGDSAPLDLGRGARRQPVDDGGRRGDDRQLPRHRHLLGRPDAAGRPVHRPRRAPTVGSEQTLSADVIDAVARIPTSPPSTRSGNIDLVYQGNLVVLGAGDVRRRARARVAAVQGAGGRPRRRCAAPSAPTR